MDEVQRSVTPDNPEVVGNVKSEDNISLLYDVSLC